MNFYQKICLAALATTATLAALTKGPNRNVNDMETLAKTLILATQQRCLR